MKDEVRFLGVDDGPFERTDETVTVFGVITRGAQYIEGVLSTRIDVDGDDATDVLVRLVRRSRFRPILRAIFLNGIFLGGFNLVDPDVLHAKTGIPVIALVRSAPRPHLVARAMRKAFPNGAERWRRVKELKLVKMPGLSLWGIVRGATMREAVAWTRATIVQGHVPEPLRLAHLIASGAARGESRGPA